MQHLWSILKIVTRKCVQISKCSDPRTTVACYDRRQCPTLQSPLVRRLCQCDSSSPVLRLCLTQVNKSITRSRIKLLRMAVSERGAADIENSLHDSVVYWTKQKVPAITCRVPKDGARLGEAQDNIETAFDSLVAFPMAAIRISMGKGTLWVFKGAISYLIFAPAIIPNSANAIRAATRHGQSSMSNL